MFCKKYSAGEYILNEGDITAEFVVVESGEVEVNSV